jgi:hypothetical protein
MSNLSTPVKEERNDTTRSPSPSISRTTSTYAEALVNKYIDTSHSLLLQNKNKNNKNNKNTNTNEKTRQKMECIKQNCANLLDAMAAMAHTHSIIVIESLSNWLTKELKTTSSSSNFSTLSSAQAMNVGGTNSGSTVNNNVNNNNENALVTFWTAIEIILRTIVEKEEEEIRAGKKLQSLTNTNQTQALCEFLAPIALRDLCERAKHCMPPQRKFWLREDLLRASIEETLDAHRENDEGASMADTLRGGSKLKFLSQQQHKSDQFPYNTPPRRGGSGGALNRFDSTISSSSAHDLERSDNMKLDEDAASTVFRAEDSIGLILARVVGLLFSLSFKEMLNYFVDALKNRLGESQRIEANWIMFAISLAKISIIVREGEVKEEEEFEENDIDAQNVQNAIMFLKAFLPTEWMPPSRAKPSNFRHGLCALLAKCIDIRALDRNGEEANYNIPLPWTRACIQARVFIMEWAKTNEKHLEDATPVLATLFAWELAGTLVEDNLKIEVENASKHPDLIDFCNGVSKRAKKLKKAAEAADVARRFFRVAKKRLDGSIRNDKGIKDAVFSVLEAGMNTLLSVQSKDFFTQSVEDKEAAHVRLISSIALSAAYRADMSRTIKIALHMLSKTEPSDAVAVAVNVAANIKLKMKSSLDTIDFVERLQKVVARAIEINQSMYSDSGYTVIRVNEQLSAIRSSYPTVAAVLRCIPDILVPNLDPVTFVPHFITHESFEIRTAAAGALSRLMVFESSGSHDDVGESKLPSSNICNRLVQAASSSLLNLRDKTNHAARESATKALASALRRRRNALIDENLSLQYLDNGEIIEPTRPEAAGLVLLCDPVISVRLAAFALLQEISHFRSMAKHFQRQQNSASKKASARHFTPQSSPSKKRNSETFNGDNLTHSVASVIEECRVQMCEAASSAFKIEMANKISSAHLSDSATILQRSATVEALLENEALQNSTLCAAIDILARAVTKMCKSASTTARAQTLQRVQAIMVLEGKGAMMQAPSNPGTYLFELWRNYVCFVCSATPSDDLEINSDKKEVVSDDADGVNAKGPKIVTLGSRGSLTTIFNLTVPCVLSGKEGQVEAILNIFERVPPFVVPKLIDACADRIKAMSSLHLSNNLSFLNAASADIENLSNHMMMMGGGSTNSSVANMTLSVSSILSTWIALVSLYKSLVLKNSPFVKSTTGNNDINARSALCINIAKFIENASFVATFMTNTAANTKDTEMKPLVEELKNSIALIVAHTFEEIHKYCPSALQKQTRMKLWTFISGWIDEDNSGETTKRKIFQNALASILAAPAFDDSMLRADGIIFKWIDSLLVLEDEESENIAHKAITCFCSNNPQLLRIAFEKTYSASASVSRIYLSSLTNIISEAFDVNSNSANESSEILQNQVLRFVPVAHLVTLSYFNLINPDRRNRKSAKKLFEAVSLLSKTTDENENEGEIETTHDANLTSALHSFLSQSELLEVYYVALCKVSNIQVLTKGALKLAPELLIEAFSRCCSSVSENELYNESNTKRLSIIRHLLVALQPWVRCLKLEDLTKGGKRQVCDRVLLGFYELTRILGAKFETQLEFLWGCIATNNARASSARNVEITLDFLLSNTVKMGNAYISKINKKNTTAANSNFLNESDEKTKSAANNFDSIDFLTVKRTCLFLARAAPRECIDRLVRAISFRALEPESEFYSNPFHFEEPDLAAVLLAEVATEHDEYFRSQLIVLVQAVVATVVTSKNVFVTAHCQQLLSNLLHNLAGQPLQRRIEDRDGTGQSSSEMQGKDGFALRSIALLQNILRRRDLDSAVNSWDINSHLDVFCHRFPDCMVFEASPRERWASEALRWVLKARSFPLAEASMNILGALRHPLDNEEFGLFLGIMCTAAAISEGKSSLSGINIAPKPPKSPSSSSSSVARRGDILEEDETITHRKLLGMRFTVSILACLRKSPFAYARIAPQTFWFGVACLRTTDEQMYESAIRLISICLMSAPLNSFGSSISFSTYASTAPLPLRTRYASETNRANYEVKPAISLRDVVPLILKGTLKKCDLIRGTAATALSAVAPYCASEVWGGKMTLACVLCGLLPIALHAFYYGDEENNPFALNTGVVADKNKKNKNEAVKKKKTFCRKEATMALQLLAEGCRTVAPTLEDTLHCILYSHAGEEGIDFHRHGEDNLHRHRMKQNIIRRAFVRPSSSFMMNKDEKSTITTFDDDFKDMYKFLDEYSGVSTLEQACELLAQPLFDEFLVPNNLAECAISHLGDAANNSEHKGSAEAALHLLCAAVTYSPSVREESSLYGETGIFHSLALETMDRQQNRKVVENNKTTVVFSGDNNNNNNSGLNENVAMKMLKSIAMNYSLASKMQQQQQQQQGLLRGGEKKDDHDDDEEDFKNKFLKVRCSSKWIKDELISDLTWGIMLSSNQDPEKASIPAYLA